MLNGAVAKLDLTVRLLLPGEGVLHPVLVVTVGVVLTGVGTTGLLTVGGGNGGLGTITRVSQHPTLQNAAGIHTRRSTGYEAQGSQQDPSSRSCCGPWYRPGRTSGR